MSYESTQPKKTCNAADLPPEAPSLITRVCRSGFHIRRRWFGQSRRARRLLSSYRQSASLPGLARVDVMPLDAVLVRPFQDRPAGELCPVITDNAGRFAIEPDERIKLPRHPCARYAGVSHPPPDRALRSNVPRGGAQVSRQQSSFTARTRNLRDAPKVSDRKSNDHRSPGLSDSGIGVRDPRARFRPRRRRTPRFSSV